ncbi:hypothetical protein HGRIS_010640 [Hohenbuehelia grisea]|uniref:Fungal N-terminal domain-containing protein n=1 Tax=Hohenbuehelia grisea TaxID=104357 RepID=A0ABR3IXP6_9AGAR
MDGFSAFSSALAIADVANKLKDSFSKVGENRRKVKNLSKDVIAGLGDIQKFCHQRGSSLNELDATELKDALDKLHGDLTDAHRHCDKLLPPTGGGPLRSVKSSIVSWWNRSDIEAEIIRMKEQIQACHLRFISFTSARTEHSVLILRQEHRVRLEQLDALYPDMLADVLLSNKRQHLRSFNANYNPDPAEVNYLSFRVRQVVSFYGSQGPMSEHAGTALDCGHPFEEHILFKLDLYSFDGYIAAISLFFRRTQKLPQWAFTKDAIRSLDVITSCIKRHASNDVAIPLATCVLESTHKIFGASSNASNHSSSPGAEEMAASDPWRGHLIMTRAACANGYLSKSSLAWSLRQSSSKLRISLKTDEALSLACEALEVQRAVLDHPDDETLSWQSCGIPSLACASNSTIVRSLRQAEHDAWCLRDLALCLAACGVYADARAVGLEALDCLGALIRGNTWFQGRADGIRMDMATWDSITKEPEPIQSSSRSPAQISVVVKHFEGQDESTPSVQAVGKVGVSPAIEPTDVSLTATVYRRSLRRKPRLR